LTSEGANRRPKIPIIKAAKMAGNKTTILLAIFT
jgi:hypothetical protein